MTDKIFRPYHHFGPTIFGFVVIFRPYGKNIILVHWFWSLGPAHIFYSAKTDINQVQKKLCFWRKSNRKINRRNRKINKRNRKINKRNRKINKRNRKINRHKRNIKARSSLHWYIIGFLLCLFIQRTIFPT